MKRQVETKPSMFLKNWLNVNEIVLMEERLKKVLHVVDFIFRVKLFLQVTANCRKFSGRDR